MVPGTYDVFISYKAEDRELAVDLNSRLLAAGFTVWFDKDRLESGFNWYRDIEEGRSNSRIVLPVLTPRWRKSEWTKYETYGAEAIIPLHFEGLWEEVAPSPLQSRQNLAIDFSAKDDSGWEKLFESIRNLVAEPPPIKATRLASVKYPPNRNFVGRESELNQIAEALNNSPTADLTQGRPFVISSMGGMGKTTLARQYAEVFWRLYRQIFWIDAQDGVLNGFAEIAKIINPNTTELSAKNLAKSALLTLSDQTERLLILDNVEDEESVQEWVPKSGGCHTIITSRFAFWSTAVKRSAINILEIEPSRELLLTRAQIEATPAVIESCDRLADRLGYLPLALEQAAAYIEQEGPGFGFNDYLKVFEDETSHILNQKSPGSTQYEDPIMMTWQTTLAKLSWEARAVLRLSSYLSPQAIPKSMFLDYPSIVHDLGNSMEFYNTGIPGEEPGADFKASCREPLRELAAYSMINSQGLNFNVHVLVQEVERAWAQDLEIKETIENCIKIIRRSRPGNMAQLESWPQWNNWRPHAQSVIHHSEHDKVPLGIEELYVWIGAWLVYIGSYNEAKPYLEKVLLMEENTSERESSALAMRLLDLARLFRQTSKPDQAEEYLKRALTICKTNPDPDPGLIDMIRTNLGLVWQSVGRLEEAEDVFRQALSAAKLDHPKMTAPQRTNLAGVLLETNQVDEAEQLYQEAFSMDLAAFGEEDPRMAMSLTNLSTLFLRTNRFDEAKKYSRRALTIVENVHGPDHPDTARCLSDLAVVHLEKMEYEAAENRLRRALKIDLEFNGPYSEKVAIRKNNLAEALMESGQLEEAEKLMRESLTIRESLLGSDHPLTFHMRGRLAKVLHRAGKYEEAEDWARQSVASWVNSETPQNEKSGKVHRTLALILRDTGRNSEAIETMQTAIAIFKACYVADDHRLVTAISELEGMQMV